MRVKTGLQKCKYGVYHAGCKRKDPCFGLNKIKKINQKKRLDSEMVSFDEEREV